MGKKKKEEMDKQRVRFLEGAGKPGASPRTRPTTSSIWWRSLPVTASTNPTPQPMPLIAYQTGWLKANHPVGLPGRFDEP
jgi:DNA polymerase-3 subunit alpha